MVRTRNSKIKDTSQQIIQYLDPKPKTVAEIVALGYSRSTVKYYQKKLFNEKAYNRAIKKIQKLNKKAKAR